MGGIFAQAFYLKLIYMHYRSLSVPLTVYRQCGGCKAIIFGGLVHSNGQIFNTYLPIIGILLNWSRPMAIGTQHFSLCRLPVFMVRTLIQLGQYWQVWFWISFRLKNPLE